MTYATTKGNAIIIKSSPGRQQPDLGLSSCPHFMPRSELRPAVARRESAAAPAAAVAVAGKDTGKGEVGREVLAEFEGALGKQKQSNPNGEFSRVLSKM